MSVGLDLNLAGGETESEIRSPHWGSCVRGEIFKAESETADLWQPKWNENQTVLAATIPSQTGTLVPWKAQRLGAGVWGLWSNPRVKTAAHCGETD